MSRKSRRKNLQRIVALLVAVVVVVIASVAFQRWWNNRPGPEPKDVAITVTVNGTEQEVLPYSICELGSNCVENKVTMLDVADDAKISIKVPRYVYDHEWTQLTIYDNPAANDEKLHGAHERDTIEVPVTIDPVEDKKDVRPRLVVVEIRSVMIGHDAQGEQTPQTATWSLGIPEKK